MEILGSLLWKPRSRADHRGRSVRGWGSSSIELAKTTLLPGHRGRADLPSLKRLWSLLREGQRIGKGGRPGTRKAAVYQSRGHEAEEEKEGEACVCIGCWGGASEGRKPQDKTQDLENRLREMTSFWLVFRADLTSSRTRNDNREGMGKNECYT